MDPFDEYAKSLLNQMDAFRTNWITLNEKLRDANSKIESLEAELSITKSQLQHTTYEKNILNHALNELRDALRTDCKIIDQVQNNISAFIRIAEQNATTATDSECNEQNTTQTNSIVNLTAVTEISNLADRVDQTFRSSFDNGSVRPKRNMTSDESFIRNFVKLHSSSTMTTTRTTKVLPKTTKIYCNKTSSNKNGNLVMSSKKRLEKLNISSKSKLIDRGQKNGISVMKEKVGKVIVIDFDEEIEKEKNHPNSSSTKNSNSINLEVIYDENEGNNDLNSNNSAVSDSLNGCYINEDGHLKSDRLSIFLNSDKIVCSSDTGNLSNSNRSPSNSNSDIHPNYEIASIQSQTQSNDEVESFDSTVVLIKYEDPAASNSIVLGSSFGSVIHDQDEENYKTFNEKDSLGLNSNEEVAISPYTAHDEVNFPNSCEQYSLDSSSGQPHSSPGSIIQNNDKNKSSSENEQNLSISKSTEELFSPNTMSNYAHAEENSSTSNTQTELIPADSTLAAGGPIILLSPLYFKDDSTVDANNSQFSMQHVINSPKKNVKIISKKNKFQETAYPSEDVNQSNMKKIKLQDSFSSLESESHSVNMPNVTASNSSKSITSKKNIGQKTKKTFCCKICGEIFPQGQKLSQHLNSVHVGDERTWTCQICGFITQTAISFSQHAKLYCYSKLSKNNGKCLICRKENRKAVNYRVKSALDIHILDNHPNPYPEYLRCPYGKGECIEHFTKPITYNKHIKIAHQDEDLRLPIKKIFPDFLQCAVCGKIFSCSAHLTRHANQVHVGNKKIFSCQFCKFSTANQKYLQIHVNRHNQKKK